MMKKIGFLVVGLFGFLLGSATFASYTQVFSDDFNRDDGVVGNNWQKVNQIGSNSYREIQSGDLLYSGGSVWSDYSFLLRPTTEMVSDGKMTYTVTVPNTGSSPMYVPAIVARYTTTAPYYVARIAPINGQMRIGRVNVGTTDLNVMSNVASEVRGTLPTTLKNEFIIETLATGTKLTLNAYDTGGTLLQTFTAMDTTNTVSSIGQWGVTSWNSALFDTIALFSGGNVVNTGFTFTADKTNVKVGTSITYTLTASTDQIITLSDNKGGVFNTNSVSLSAGNSYTTIVTYTPTQAGNATITASGGDEVKTSQIFASPYSTTIGYIGDSITQGVGAGSSPNAVQVATTILGTGFIAINDGVSSSTTKSWITNYLANAISDFQNNGVDVVSIMLGTNDAKISENISIDDYKANIETMITSLKNAGIKKIILNEPPYLDITRFSSNFDNSSLIKLMGYSVVLGELADGETVIIGDTQTYEYFENHLSELGDGAHPNSLGHQHLGEFRAEAIKSAIEYQINPDHHFISGDSHTLQTTGSLIFRVDKYFGEFSNVVKVDTVQISSGYTATSGSTNITLESNYLNTLSTGNHTLTVGFDGGVRVSDTFTILPVPVTPPVTPPNTPSGDGGGGGSASKDNCPNGDFSASYYDGECGTNPSDSTSHLADTSAENATNGDTSTSNSVAPGQGGRPEDGGFANQEILTAYQRAYNHNITTLAPLENANPDGTVIRGHLAKMVVNYALNALGWTLPEKVPSHCHRKDGSNAWESQEMKDYAVKACLLGLMGMDMNYFQPYTKVSRAQFGTVLSRLLYGNEYAGGKPYYAKHLQALQENGIITQIDNPEARIELRQRVRLMLMRSSKN